MILNSPPKNFCSILFSNNLLNYANSQTTAGFRVGFGSDCFVAENLAIKFNYLYTWYGSISGNTKANVMNTASTINNPQLQLPGPGSFIDSSTAKINTQAITVGLNYYFGNNSYTK